MTNGEYYAQQVIKFTEEGCALPEAAALAVLIEKCIREKNYTIYNEETADSLDKFDVICKFNFAGDPQFGLYKDDDDKMMIISTPEGLKGLFI